jgi:hypothetical protein
MKLSTKWLVLFVGFVLAPAAVFAQTGAIAGVVRDTSNAVLPGVSVEASSPALIERTRTVVTDEQGRYNIVDLRPGTYTVTFTLTGFTSVKREGLELSAATVLPLNADMKVGSIEETVTVLGETPVVDVESVRQRQVLGREVLETIPRSRDAANTAGLLAGVTAVGVQDSGGSGAGVISQIVSHGSDGGDQQWNIDGMKASTGGRRVLISNDASAQEVVYEMSGMSAEYAVGGFRMNIVPKEGGNTFRGGFMGTWTTNGLTSSNLNADLKARGALSAPRIDRAWDVSPSLGGPIKENKLWFFFTYRNWGSDGNYPNIFYDSDPKREAENPNRLWDANLRLTTQVSERNKLAVYYDRQGRSQPFRFVSNLQSPEAGVGQDYPSMYVTQARWTTPVTNKLLFEAGVSYYNERYILHPTPAYPGDGTLPHFEITTGLYTRAPPVAGGTLGPNYDNRSAYKQFMTSLQYVTGSHTTKIGFTNYWGQVRLLRADWPLTLRYNNGVPFQVTIYALPQDQTTRLNYDMGVYAQHNWTLKRFTLTGGLRLDVVNDQLDAQTAAAGTYVPARTYPEIDDQPNWKDVSPRFGVAWDVFGNGKTAVKGSVSRYLRENIGGYAGQVNPLAVTSDTRTWNDANKDGIAQPSEWGPTTNVNFGLPVVVTLPTDDVRLGWQKRPYNWEYAAAVQHQVMPGLSANVGYYRRMFGNLTWTQNTLVSQSEYTPFTIKNPIDGTPITLYDLNPAKRGVSFSQIAFAPNDSIVFDGVDLTVIGKFGRGGIVNAGIATGRTSSKLCTQTDPNNLRFCEISPGFFAQNQYKLIVSVPPVYGVRLSATFQSVPGPVFALPVFPPTPGILANYTVTSAIAGRTLTNGTITTKLIEPGTQYGDRTNKLDLRVAKLFRFGNARIDPFIDFFNIFNQSAVVSENTTYGPSWRVPSDILNGRVIELGVQFNF